VAFQLILTSRSILSYGLLGNDGAVVDLHIDRDLEVSDLKRVALPMVEGEDETPLRIGTVNCGLPLVLMHGPKLSSDGRSNLRVRNSTSAFPIVRSQSDDRMLLARLTGS
jgi:hypothetical protein